MFAICEPFVWMKERTKFLSAEKTDLISIRAGVIIPTT